MKLLGLIVALVLLTGIANPALAATIAGRVISVADGDTITILTPEKEQIKIRLVEIDAPEKTQPFGQNSKKALSDLVFGKDVRVESDKTDRYGRTLGRVFVGEVDVNLQQVQGGYAWAYTKYLTDQRIKDAETAARQAKTGLWALQSDQIMPPWEWRHGGAGKKTAP